MWTARKCEGASEKNSIKNRKIRTPTPEGQSIWDLQVTNAAHEAARCFPELEIKFPQFASHAELSPAPDEGDFPNAKLRHVCRELNWKHSEITRQLEAMEARIR